MWRSKKANGVEKLLFLCSLGASGYSGAAAPWALQPFVGGVFLFFVCFLIGDVGRRCMVLPCRVFFWLAGNVASLVFILDSCWLVIRVLVVFIRVLPFCFNVCVCQMKAMMFPPFSFRLFYWFFSVITEVVSPPSVILFCPQVMFLCGVVAGLDAFGHSISIDRSYPLSIVVCLKESFVCSISCVPSRFPLVGTQCMYYPFECFNRIH